MHAPAIAEENQDICELPDGTQLDGTWMAKVLCAPEAAGMTISIPAADVVRGPHSVAARLLLHHSSAAALPSSVFIKRVVPRQLPPRAATKWIRDAQSYRAEVGFYAHYVEPLRKQGVQLPITYKVVSQGLDDLSKILAEYESSPDTVPAEAVADVVQRCHFLCFVEDLNPAMYRQDMLLGSQEMERVLCAMARMHAAHWEDVEVLRDASLRLFAQGAYWSPDKRDPSEVSNLPCVWDEFLTRFAGTLGEDLSSRQGVKTLGARLSASAPKVTERIRLHLDAPHQCIVHGDLKTANILFAADWEPAAAGDSGVCLIDFQWTGVGLAAQDLLYCFVSSAHLEVLESPQEMQRLLQVYLKQVGEHSQGRSAAYSLEQLERDMDWVLLEYARTVFGYQLKGKGPEWLEGGADTLGRCAHNRSAEHLRWLVDKVEKTLSRLDAGQLE